MMKPPKIYPLFSAPVYIRNVGNFDLPAVKDLEFTSRLATGENHTFMTSVDKYVLNRPEFSHIHDIVLAEVNGFARECLRVSSNIDFYITNSWININRPGDHCVPHSHNNSLISGVLYLKAPESGGDLIFYRDINSLLPFPPALDLDMDAQNIYNCKHFGHTPQTFDICLFPSILMHSVGVNESNEERWCLPFNVFVKGELNGLHKLVLQ